MKGIALENGHGELLYVSLRKMVKCQHEYDLNKDHHDVGGFYEFVSEFFRDEFGEQFVKCINKAASPDFEAFCEARSEWNAQLKAKRFANKHAIRMINKAHANKKRRWLAV